MKINILIINPFGVGDVLFSTPLVSVSKEEWPECFIGYICNIRTQDILLTNPEVDEIFVFERDEYRLLWGKSKLKCIKELFNFWNQIRKRKFDIVFDLSLGKEYAFFCWLVGIKERRGFNYKGRGRFLTYNIPFDGFSERSVAEYYLDLFRSCGEVERTLFRPVLVPTDNDKAYIDDFLTNSGISEGDILVGIAPGGGISFGKKDQEKRRWGAKKFSELANKIIKKFNAKIILIWGLGEEKLVNEIAGLMNNHLGHPTGVYKVLIAPKTSIREMAALCKRCKLIICSEGGPLHIASSQGVKTISIFGPVDESVYGAYPPGEDNVVITSNIECRPCYKRFKLPECQTRQCLEDISVDEVFRIVEARFL